MATQLIYHFLRIIIFVSSVVTAQPRPAVCDGTGGCCDGVPFPWDTQGCCEGTTVYTYNTEGCDPICGGVYKFSEQQICTAATPNACRTFATQGCDSICGGIYLYAEREICQEGTADAKCREFATQGCCEIAGGAQLGVYSFNTQKCCETFDSAMGEIGGIYDAFSHTQGCCNPGGIYTFAKDEECCDGEGVYNTKSQGCCDPGGLFTFADDEECCDGQGIYNVYTQGCCMGDDDGSNQIYSLKRQICCNGKVYHVSGSYDSSSDSSDIEEQCASIDDASSDYHYAERRQSALSNDGHIMGEDGVEDMNDDNNHITLSLSKTSTINLWAVVILFVVLNMTLCICYNKKMKYNQQQYVEE